jgi:hypothetical protein
VEGLSRKGLGALFSGMETAGDENIEKKGSMDFGATHWL